MENVVVNEYPTLFLMLATIQYFRNPTAIEPSIGISAAYRPTAVVQPEVELKADSRPPFYEALPPALSGRSWFGWYLNNSMRKPFYLPESIDSDLDNLKVSKRYNHMPSVIGATNRYPRPECTFGIGDR
jgi:hypothetical protein